MNLFETTTYTRIEYNILMFYVIRRSTKAGVSLRVDARSEKAS